MLLDLGPDLPPPTATLAAIPDGREGTRATLKLMARLTRDGKRALPVRLAAQQLVQSLPQRDYAAEVKRLHAFVRDRIRYVRDIRGVETLQDAERTLTLKSGDCDDKSVLLASLLESIGHRTRFRAVGVSPNRFSHVYVESLLGRGWVPLETTEPWEAGRAPMRTAASMIENV